MTFRICQHRTYLHSTRTKKKQKNKTKRKMTYKNKSTPDHFFERKQNECPTRINRKRFHVCISFPKKQLVRRTKILICRRTPEETWLRATTENSRLQHPEPVALLKSKRGCKGKGSVRSARMLFTKSTGASKSVSIILLRVEVQGYIVRGFFFLISSLYHKIFKRNNE